MILFIKKISRGNNIRIAFPSVIFVPRREASGHLPLCGDVIIRGVMPPQLSPVLDVRRRLERIASEAKMSLADLAVRFILSLEGVCCLVMGLETIEQLQDNLKIFTQGPLKSGLLHDVLETVPQLPDNVIVPSLWPKCGS